VLTVGSDEHQVLLDLADGLAQLAAFTLGWFFVVTVPLHVPREPFTLAQSLKTLQHLLDGFITTRPDLYHTSSDLDVLSQLTNKNNRRVIIHDVRAWLLQPCLIRLHSLDTSKVSL
jgi:hypothetical protein